MKTKTFKRLAAAVAAITMMCAVPMMSGGYDLAFAAGNHTITISSYAGEEDIEHSYVAYQIFKGDLSGSVLSNIDWGNGVDKTTQINGKTLIQAINAISVSGSAPFSGCTTVTDVVNVLKNINASDDAVTKAFADTVAKYKTGTPVTSSTLRDQNSDITGYKIDVTANGDGYYLVEDSTNVANSAKTRYILNVTSDVTIAPKMEYPTLKKEVNNGNSWSSANTGTIGKNVDYKLSSKVPSNIGDYNKYFFIVNDTLDTGLTLNYASDSSNRGTANSFTVKVGDTTLTDITNITYDAAQSKYTDSTAYTDTGTSYYVIQNGQEFKLVFVNFKQYDAGKDITIEYKATLNSNAAFGTTGATANTNTADLTYSSDPNYYYYGDPGDVTTYHPRPDDPSTPQDETKPKPDEPNESKQGDNDDPSTPQDESKPEPKSDTPDQKVVTYTASLKITKTKSDSTSVADGEAGFTVFDSTGNNVVLEEKTTLNGIVELKGLGAGTYIIRETKVPAGFNQAPDYTLVIDASADSNSCTWSVGQGSTTNNNADVFSVINSEYGVSIVNQAGTTLPSTGGIGTTIFYVSGGALILGAGIVLVTKKRMSLKDDK